MSGHVKRPSWPAVAADQCVDGLFVADIERPQVEAVRILQAPQVGARPTRRGDGVAIGGQLAYEIRADEPAGAGHQDPAWAHGSDDDGLRDVLAARSAGSCSLRAEDGRCRGSLRISSTTYAGRDLISSNIAAT